MQRLELNLLVDWILFGLALPAFATGILLLLYFHAGQGAFTTSAFGLSKLVWLNLHRFWASVLALGVVIHVGLHWRAFRVKLTNVVMLKTKRPINLEVIMYTTFFITAFAGFVLWFVLEGSSPLFGPALIGRASSIRHPWIDTHYIVSFVSLMFVIHHVRHRWSFMARLRREHPAEFAQQ